MCKKIFSKDINYGLVILAAEIDKCVWITLNWKLHTATETQFRMFIGH